MHHKLLLGSSALVSAGVLLASATPASAQMEVRLTGYTEFGVAYSEEENQQFDNVGDRGYGAFMDTEVHVLADAVSDSGVEYGGKVEFEVFSGSGASDTTADEAVVFMSGGFGRLELGREDGAEDVMFVGGEDVAAGTGGIDGDTTVIPFQVRDTSDAAKITYFTPRIAGFQLGASWTPDTGDDFGVDDGDDFENTIGFGANWTGNFTGLEFTLAAVGHYGKAETGPDDIQDWEVGFNTEVAGFAVGAAYGQATDFAEAQFANAGLGYGFGPVNTSIGWVWYDPDDPVVGGDSNLFVVSADVGVLPGVVLKGDVAYNTDDTQSFGGDLITEGTAGVVTLQLNY
ncbi:MAG TPA: porin [Geminicoccaceae bacterium]